MPDADHRRCRQGIGDQAIERRLLLLIGRRGGLIEEQPVRLDQEGAGDREPLLLARATAPAPNARPRPGVGAKRATRRRPMPPAPRHRGPPPVGQETTAPRARSRSACRAAAAGTASWHPPAGGYARSQTATIPRGRGTACSCRCPRVPVNSTGSCGLKLSVTGASSGVPSGSDTPTSCRSIGVLHGRFRARANDCRGGLALDLGGELGQPVRPSPATRRRWCSCR